MCKYGGVCAIIIVHTTHVMWPELDTAIFCIQCKPFQTYVVTTGNSTNHETVRFGLCLDPVFSQ